MSRSLAFQFSSLCGISYDSGDIKFTPNNRALLSPVGHRLNRFGLTTGGSDSSCETYSFETLSPIRKVGVSKTFLLVIDTESRCLFCNQETGAILHRFNVKGDSPVRAVEFSIDEDFVALAVGRKVQVWKCPNSLNKVFSPMTFHHEFAIHSDEILSFSWTTSGFLTGSKDCTAHLQYSRVHDGNEFLRPNPWETSVSLVGHRSPVIGAFDLARNLEEPCIFTISEDGAVFEWRFSKKSAQHAKHHAKRKRLENDFENEWQLKSQHFVQANNQTITCCSVIKSLLLVGFSDGVFSLFELPSCQNLQSLSASKFALESCAISSDGSWLALASPTMGQLLVWEWLSETFVLRQQGHYYTMNSISYSTDGRIFCSGGDDGKLKLWSTSTNTCFVTFTEHTAPITGSTFVSNNALLSCSLDGTCRAFDLIRLRNFRTMTPPQPTQLTCIATDGEVVCCGSMEPYQIFVWSLRTGKLLDILSGHTGPISCLEFAQNKPLLASSSWDGSVKLWEPFSSTKCLETLIHSSPVNQLSLAFRPDGKELCSTGLDGYLSFWKVDGGVMKSSIDCRRDLEVKEKVNRCFLSVCYSADGKYVLAGGKSTWVFAYDCEKELLLKKYQLAHRVRVRDLYESVDDDSNKVRWRESRHLPGVQRGKDAGKRRTIDPEIQVNSLRFSPTGRSWIAATNGGLLVFSLDIQTNFEPMDIDINCTPQTTRLAALNGDFAKACLQSIFLGDDDLITEMISSVPLESLSLVAKSIPKSKLPKCVNVIAQSLDSNTCIQYYLKWALALFSCIRESDTEKYRNTLLPSFRNLQRAILKQEKVLANICDENLYDMVFLTTRVQ